MLKQNERYKKPSNDIIIEVMAKNGGILASVATALKVSRGAIYTWINEDSELKESLYDIRQSMIDFAEGKLFKQIDEGNIVAILFYLKTQGKSRGYVEGIEMAVTQRTLAPTTQIIIANPHYPQLNGNGNGKKIGSPNGNGNTKPTAVRPDNIG